MIRPNSRLSFNVIFDELTGGAHQDETIEPRRCYRGTSVQVLNSPLSPYLSQSDADQSNARSISPLRELRVASLTQAIPDGFDELGIPVIPETILNEYVPYNSNNESVDDATVSIAGSYSDLCNQSCFSGNEPDIREPALTNRLNPDRCLTSLLAELASLQDSQAVAVINPLNLQQATSDNPANSAEIVDDKSSQVERIKKRRRERQRERYQNDSAYAERQREIQRERYRNNPVLAERQRENRRKRYQNDPVFAERERERSRKRYQNDPVYAERKKKRYQNDPVYAGREGECTRRQRIAKE